LEIHLKKTMTTESFAKHCDQFLTSIVVQPLAQYVVDHHEEIKGTNVAGLCTLFQKQLSLAAPMQPLFPNISVATALAPSMTPPSGGFPALGAPTAPAPKSSSRKSASIWVDGKVYMQKVRAGECICAYRSPRQPNKDMICGCPATTTLRNLPSDDHRNRRCAACKNKIGSIMRMTEDGSSSTTSRSSGRSRTATAASASPQISGINIPITSTGSAVPAQSSSITIAGSNPITQPLLAPQSPATVVADVTSILVASAATAVGTGTATSVPASASGSAQTGTRKTLDIIDLKGHGEGFALVDDKAFDKVVVNTTQPYPCLGKLGPNLDPFNLPSGFQTRLLPLDAAEIAGLKSIYGLDYKP
jgi:hypothetical protein